MMTRAELAAHYGVSERTIARLQAEGMPFRQVRGRPRYDLAEVDPWIKEQPTCPTGKTSKAGGTSKPRTASVVDFTDAARRVQVRATPSS